MLITTISSDGKPQSVIRSGHPCMYRDNCDFIDLHWTDETGKTRWIGMNKSELRKILQKGKGELSGNITFDVPLELMKSRDE